MKIHCPNCKQTTDSIIAPPALVLYFFVALFFFAGAGETIAAFKTFDGGNTILLILAILFAPLSPLSFGFAVSLAQRISYDDKPQRCSVCKYPWGVPAEKMPSLNTKPPVVK